MRSDMKLRKNVENELNWEPSVDIGNIGVAVKDGIVTLTGHVPSYWEKVSAERVVKKISRVKGIANDLEVSLPGGHERTDTEIADEVVQALEANVSVPAASIKTIVKNGKVTLEGNVDWHYQKGAAERTVRHLRGVRRIRNNIKIVPKIVPHDVESKIVEAFERRARLDAKAISIKVDGNSVTMEGNVHSLAELNDAIEAAWSAPGVARVVDRLHVTD